MTVVSFPRCKLPDDAHFLGRPREVMVYPASGGWACYVADDDGGCWLAEGVTKAEALAMGTEVALYWNAELVLRNRWERL
jgi:hypothetical protein